ncbi:MAG: hypothetical protein ACP5OG_01405 [Candidatus Nanoarchaeia archaeon]
MNSKKFSVYAIFTLMVISSLVVNVSAIDCNDSTLSGWEKFTCTTLSFVSPIGFDNQWTGIVMGILATIVIFAIVLDVATIGLPFSMWVNYVISIAFVIAAAMLGLIRSIAGWALTLGAMLVGTAGALAMVASAVIIVLVIITLFWGNQKLAKFAVRARGNRAMLEKEADAYKKAANITQGGVILDQFGKGMNNSK